MQKSLYEGFEKYVEKSHYKKELNQVMQYVMLLINESKLHPSSLEIQILGNHLSEMVNRAKKEEKLDKVDTEIFENVTPRSMEISQKIVHFIEKNIGPISDSEKYILSIHFENMNLK